MKKTLLILSVLFLLIGAVSVFASDLEMLYHFRWDGHDYSTPEIWVQTTDPKLFNAMWTFYKQVSEIGEMSATKVKLGDRLYYRIVIKDSMPFDVATFCDWYDRDNLVFSIDIGQIVSADTAKFLAEVGKARYGGVGVIVDTPKFLKDVKEVRIVNQDHVLKTISPDKIAKGYYIVMDWPSIYKQLVVMGTCDYSMDFVFKK